MPKIRPVKKQDDSPREPELFGEPDEIKKETDQDSQGTESLASGEHKEDHGTPPPDDAAEALRKQIEELRKSEEVQRNLAQQYAREREEAQRLAKERTEELKRIRTESTKAKADSIDAAIAAAKAEADAAERDFAAAAEIGDTKAQAEAQRRMARAEANVGRLEDGKAALAEEKEAATEETKAPEQQQDPLEVALSQWRVPDVAKNWVRQHPEYFREPRKNAKLQNMHWEAQEEAGEEYTPKYFEILETKLGLRQKKDSTDDDDDGREQRRSPPVSAPVSRESTDHSGKRQTSQVRLTVAQQEAARAAGITDTEYAKQLQKYHKLKEEGYYGDRR